MHDQTVHHVLCTSMIRRLSCRTARNRAVRRRDGWHFAGVLALWLNTAGLVVAQPPAATGAAPRPPDRIPLARLTPDATVAVAAAAGWAVTADAIWIPVAGARAIRRVDPKTNMAGDEIRLEHPPCASLVVAFDSVWVPLCDGKVTARLDPTKGTVTGSVGLAPAAAQGRIAVAVGSVWIASDARGVVSRLDPATNAAVAEVYLAGRPVAIAGSDDGLWISSEDGDVVAQVNPHTNVVVEAVKVGPRPGRLAVGEGAVWVLNRGDGSVTRIDPKTAKVMATIAVDGAVGEGDIAAGEGSVWVSASGVPLVRIDPRSNRVVQRFDGEGGGVVVLGHGSVWVNAGPALLWRLDPLLVAGTRP
jgi:YVTN family beta-propeller protein